MGNKVSIAFEATGAEASAAKIDKLGAALDRVTASAGGGGRLGLSAKGLADIAKFPAHIRDQILSQIGGSSTLSAPPIMRRAAGPNFGMAALGLGAAGFSPWVGARLLSQAFGGGGGAGGGGVGAALFGAGGLGGFAGWFVALEAGTRALTFEFHQLAEAVRRGAKLFLDASVAGKNPGQLFALQAAGRSIGISPDRMSRLAAQANLSMTGRPVQAGDTVLRAARGLGDSALATRLMQNRQLFDQVYRDFSSLGQALDPASRNLYEFQTVMGQLGDLLKGTLVTVVGDLIKPFTILAYTVEQTVVALNKLIDLPKAIETLIFTTLTGGSTTLGLLGPKILSSLPNLLPSPDLQSKLPSGSFAARPESGWEKMGLIVQGGVGALDYAKQTADNTKRLVEIASGKGNAAGTVVPYGMVAQSVFNLP